MLQTVPSRTAQLATIRTSIVHTHSHSIVLPIEYKNVTNCNCETKATTNEFDKGATACLMPQAPPGNWTSEEGRDREESQ